MLNVKEVAKRLGVSPSNVYRLIEAGAIAHHRIGGAIRISEEQIVEFLNTTKRERREGARPVVRPRRLTLKHIHR